MNISIEEIQNVVKIIDACCERGAFNGDEMVVVGTVRNKFASVVEEALKKQSEADQVEGP